MQDFEKAIIEYLISKNIGLDISIKEMSKEDFKEEEHPRASDGKFAKKNEIIAGATTVATLVGAALLTKKKVNFKKLLQFAKKSGNKKLEEKIIQRMEMAKKASPEKKLDISNVVMDETKIIKKKIKWIEDNLTDRISYGGPNEEQMQLIRSIDSKFTNGYLHSQTLGYEDNVHHIMDDVKSITKYAPLRRKLKDIDITGKINADGDYLDHHIRLRDDLLIIKKYWDRPHTRYIKNIQGFIEEQKNKILKLKQDLDKYEKLEKEGVKWIDDFEWLGKTKRSPVVTVIGITKDRIIKAEKIIKNSQYGIKKAKENPLSIKPFAMDEFAKNESSGIFIHEYAHALHDENKIWIKHKFGLGWEKIQSEACKNYTQIHLSTYAEKNDPECFAEGFVAYFLGKYDRIHPEMLESFDAMFPEYAKKYRGKK